MGTNTLGLFLRHLALSEEVGRCRRATGALPRRPCARKWGPRPRFSILPFPECRSLHPNPRLPSLSPLRARRRIEASVDRLPRLL